MTYSIPTGWMLCEWTLLWQRDKLLVEWHRRIPSHSNAAVVIQRVQGLAKAPTYQTSNFRLLKDMALDQVLNIDIDAYHYEREHHPIASHVFKRVPKRGDYALLTHLRGWPPFEPLHYPTPVLTLPTS